MTKARLLRLFLFALAIMTIAVGAYAFQFQEDFAYYSNTYFTTQIGDQFIDCDGSETDWGTFSPYRIRNAWRCSDGKLFSHGCEEYDYGTQTWIAVACP
jgi:hypothetical protein